MKGEREKRGEKARGTRIVFLVLRPVYGEEKRARSMEKDKTQVKVVLWQRLSLPLFFALKNLFACKEGKSRNGENAPKAGRGEMEENTSTKDRCH